MLFRKLFRKKHSPTDNFDTPLLRCLNLFDLIFLSVSGMIGSGIYVLTGVVAKDLTGPAIIISNLLAAIACLFGAFCYAEFAARIPQAGSSYRFIYESIGEIFAFLVGFTSIVGSLAGLSVSVRVCSAYFDALFNNTIASVIIQHVIHWPNAHAPFAKYPDLLALFIVILLALAMFIGVRNSKYVTNFLTVLNMSALLFIGITGFILGDKRNYQEFIPFGTQNIFRGSSLLLYSYIGFETATTAIEEAKNPSKTVPRATVISLIIVMVLYSLAGASLTYLIPYNSINKEFAFAHAYSLSKWPWASYMISVAIVFSAGGNLLSGTYATIRIIYAMSTDGLLPTKLSHVNQGRHVPVFATFISCFIIGILSTFFDIKDLIGFADISALLSYIGVSIGILIERYDHHISYRIILDTDNVDDNEEMFNLNDKNEIDNRDVEITDLLDSDPILTRFTRSLCPSLSRYIDSYLSPKLCSVIFILIFTVNTSILSMIVINVFNSNHTLSIIFICICVFVDMIILFVFCLLRPKKHSKNLLFSCPGIPLIPLVNINIFIFLMVYQELHEWFAYLFIIIITNVVYFSYSYRHSKLC